VALTGTPGVGKSAVAAALAARWRSVEVADLALRTGAGRRTRGGVLVDLPRLRAALREAPALLAPVDIIVGHLAHLLPVREAIVLRCQPLALGRRLARARRGNRTDRGENVVSEALDLVLAEALRARRPVFEIDTTAKHVEEVAVEVDRRLRLGGPSRFGLVDWLADPTVTEHLLEGAG
jgi:broad-specificity NMP kinase